jgi:hypothetical protein
VLEDNTTGIEDRIAVRYEKDLSGRYRRRRIQGIVNVITEICSFKGLGLDIKGGVNPKICIRRIKFEIELLCRFTLADGDRGTILNIVGLESGRNNVGLTSWANRIRTESSSRWTLIQLSERVFVFDAVFLEGFVEFCETVCVRFGIRWNIS